MATTTATFTRVTPRRWIPFTRTLISQELPPSNFKSSPYNGPIYEEAVSLRTQHLAPCIKTNFKKPLMIHQGHRQWLFDHDGKRYLDMFGGIVTISVGHSHPRINKALQEQSEKLWHVANLYMHPRVQEYAQRLADKMPGDLKVVYFMNSGSEANDMAILLARLYSGNMDIIALRNAYHGGSATCISLNALNTWKYTMSVSNIHHVLNPDVYNGPYGGKRCRDSPVQVNRSCDCIDGECKASQQYFEDVNEIVKYCTPKGRVAGFIAESIQGVGGVTQYPKGYLKKVYDLIRRNGGVCIADEVQTGFGRTGDNFWAFQSHGVVPDIVTMAKGIGNGFPLAALVTTPTIAEALKGANHYNTFSGNPLASAVGNEVLKVIDDEGLQNNSLETGTYLLKKLKTLRDKYPIVGDVRGKGLMVGVEMVSDMESKSPLDPSKVSAIWELCREKGLLIGVGGYHLNVFRIKPPMCITKDDVDFTVDVFEHCVQQVS